MSMPCPCHVHSVCTVHDVQGAQLGEQAAQYDERLREMRDILDEAERESTYRRHIADEAQAAALAVMGLLAQTQQELQVSGVGKAEGG